MSLLRDVQNEHPYLTNRWRLSDIAGSQYIQDDVGGLVIPVVGIPVLGEQSLVQGDPLTSAIGGYYFASSNGFQGSVAAFNYSNGATLEGVTSADLEGQTTNLLSIPGQAQLQVANAQVVWTVNIGNFVPNPSFENDTPGSPPAQVLASVAGSMINAGSSLNVVTPTSSGFGSHAMAVTTTAASASQGFIVPILGLQQSTQYTFSVYLRGNVGGEVVKKVIGTYPGGILRTQSGGVTLTTSYARTTFTYTTAVGETAIYVGIATNTAASVIFNADALMLNQGATANTYTDSTTAGGPGVATAITTTSAPLIGYPQLVQGVYDPVAQLQLIYVDGALVLSRPLTGSIAGATTGNTQILMPAAAVASLIPGQDIASYNGPLSANRVLQHFQAFQQAWLDPAHVGDAYPSIGSVQ